MMLNYAMWIKEPQTQNLFTSKPCNTSLKTMKQWSIKGRSPTMRHVSRIYRVALDLLFDRINLGTQNPNQICWHHRTTRWPVDEMQFRPWWVESSSPFLRHYVFFSMFSCSHFSPINFTKTMSKRQMQEEKPGEEERVVAKSKPMMSSVSKIANRSPTALGSGASGSPGDTRSTKFEFRPYRYGETRCGRIERKHSIEFSSVAYLDANTISSTGKPVAETTKKTTVTTTLRYLGTMLTTLRKSIHMCDSNWVVFKETKCLTSTSTQWSVESFCQRLWRRQYILDKITKRIWVQPRIRLRKGQNSVR